jgi:hypothetical protein
MLLRERKLMGDSKDSKPYDNGMLAFTAVMAAPAVILVVTNPALAAGLLVQTAAVGYAREQFRASDPDKKK